MVTLQAGDATVELAPDDGGRIRQITVGDRGLLRDAGPGWAFWGSYPLLPWCNRIPEGALRFEGEEWRLPVNWPDGTAIHGLTAWVPWEVESADDTTAALAVHATEGPYDVVGRQRFTLTPTHLDQSLEVTNQAGHRVPVGLGIHPWFAVGAVAVPAELVWPADDRCLPTGAPVAASGEQDLRSARLPAPMDACFTGLSGQAARVGDLTLSWTGPVSQVVVYSAEPGWVCVEPVTMANDGFRLHHEGVPGGGTIVLDPGQSVAVDYRFSWVGDQA